MSDKELLEAVRGIVVRICVSSDRKKPLPGKVADEIAKLVTHRS